MVTVIITVRGVTRTEITSVEKVVEVIAVVLIVASCSIFNGLA